ncbi:type VI secretion protein EvpB [Enterobacter hormaechei]|uniref:type VI secretion system contractile sheath large subunit n=40 Tax=Enterobacteriaceae TaxID=543 RepID=UPI00125B3A03|nr:type VI secretion protein EvpB [Enterobacter hormaechei]
MSVNTETASAQGQTTVLEKEGVYASLFEKINLTPASSLGDINAFLDDAALSDAPAGERLTAAMQVFMDCIRKSGQPVEKLDKTLIDHHIAELDFQISRQLDAVMHHQEFQKVESLWRGLKQLVYSTDYRQNVKTEILDVSKEDLRQDFEDAPELIQSGLYWHTYTAEYDTPGGEPIGSVISSYEFDASPQDVALLRNISKVSAAAHMPFIGSVGPKFFLKDSMEEVAAIKDIGNYFDRAEYIKWKSFRDTDDARYIGLVMPRVLGRLPYGPDTVPVRSFNYVEQVKGPDHEKYLWTSASFSFASNMVKSFINNGWCVQIRGPQAGGAVKDLPIHLYDLGTGNQVKIPSEVMIPETREFEFANLGFIPLSYYKNRDYACFFSANSAQKADLYRINFYRLCQLLEKRNPGRPLMGSTSHPGDDPVRFAPHPGMGFPASELKAVEYDEDDDSRPPLIRTTFMGMYGVDSPLPMAYLDDIAQRREGHDALQGFLDIFSHRILTQFYRIWRKYSYPATFEPGGTDSISQSLLGLVGLGIPGTADHIATPLSRFLALLGVLQQPGKTQEGMQALVTLLAPDTTVKVSPYCLRPVEMGQPLGFYGDDDFLLDGNTPLGDEAMDAGSQLLVALTTDNEQEAQGWKPDGLLYQDFLVMLRVWLGWRFKAKITLTTRTRLLAVPPLGEGPFWLGMNGVLGADEGELKDDIPPTFTTELGYYTGLKPAIPQQGNRRVTYKFD